MDVSANLSDIFESFCVRLDADDLKRLANQSSKFCLCLDQMGKLSAKAQNLKHILTSSQKLTASDQALYVLWTKGHTSSHSILLGYLKCGPRSLYLYNGGNECKPSKPICLFDFFVYNDAQRRGYGKILYDAMLKGEKVKPNWIAIDKPSDILLKFLAKRYNLVTPSLQANNYVIFPGFFDRNTNQNHEPEQKMCEIDMESHKFESSFMSDLNSSLSATGNHTKDGTLNKELPLNEIVQYELEEKEHLPVLSTNGHETENSVEPKKVVTLPATDSYDNVSKKRLLSSLGHHKLW